MRIIFGKHDCVAKEYVWEVPEGMNVRKGDPMLVDTARGTTVAIAMSDVIEGENLECVAARSGAYFPLKKVLGFCGPELRQYIRNHTANAISREICDVIKAEFVCDVRPF